MVVGPLPYNPSQVPETLRIPSDRLAEAHEAVDALARRAGRLGLSPLELHDTGRRERDPAGVEYAHIVLAGEAPRLGGWRLVAELRHTPGATEARPLGEAEVDLDPWRSAPPRCEHCGVRRARKQTYLVQHAASGRLAQVGSSCLADFTGHDPGAALRRASHLARARALLDAEPARPAPAEEEASGAIGLREYLAHAAALARIHGFVPIARSGERRPTAELALESLRGAQGVGAPLITPADEDHARAERAIAWARSELSAREGLSDYERELVAVCSHERLRPHEVGLAASLLFAHARATPLGAPGERIEVEALLERVSPTRRGRFPAFAHAFRDALGRRLTWFASSLKLAEGERYRLSATVCRHERFRGEPATVLTHCRAEVIRADR